MKTSQAFEPARPISLKRFAIIGATILFVATFFVYSGALWNDFVEFDDNLYVTHNSHTAAGLSPSSFYYAWTTIDTGNWIPLTWLSFQLDATLYGIRPAGFHATNVILHAANVALLFAWLIRTTGSRWRSFAVAMLFGIHPLHVESVAWIAERKDVLSTFWMLIAMHAYERYAKRPNVKWYLATCVAYLFGLLSKSMVVMLPVLFFVTDIWPLQRWKTSNALMQSAHRYPRLRVGYLFLEKIPLLALSLLVGIMTIVSQSHSTAFKQPASSPIERLMNVVHSYGWYLLKTFNPTELMALYPRSADGWPRLEIAAAFLLLIGISVYVTIFRTSRQYFVFGWLWYLISFLPVIGLLQVGFQSHADRYSYVPHIGLFVMIVWESCYWVTRFPAIRRSAALAMTMMTLTLIWLTTCQIAVWRTTDRLWMHALSIDPRNSFAHGSLAMHCLEMGRIDEAARHFDFIVRQTPEKKPAIDSFVAIYRKYLGRPDAQSEFRTELGNYYANEKSTEQAIIAFEQAVSISPENTFARYKLALALGELGRFHEAAAHLEKLIEQDPDEINAHIALGLLREKMGQLAAALAEFVIVLKQNPDNEATINKVKSLNQRLGLH